MLIVWRILPEKAARVRSRIMSSRNVRNTQVQNLLLLAMLLKRRTNARRGRTRLRKTSDVILQCKRHILARNGRVGCRVVESILQVRAVQARGHAEQVRVGLVVESAVEVVGVALEDDVCEGRCESQNGVCVSVCAVVDRWVQNVGNVVGYVLLNIGQVSLEEACVAVAVDAGGWCEKQALVRIVADHKAQVLVEVAFEQQLSRHLGHKGTVNSWSVGISSIWRSVYLFRVGGNQLRSRKLTSLLHRANIEEAQELLKGGLLLLVGSEGIPPRALDNSLLERQLSTLAPVRSNLVEDGSSSCRFPNHSDALRITSKEVNVLLHPFQG